MRFKDKVILITGAATGSKAQLMGFGGAAAWLFAAEGAWVVMTDINNELGERSAKEIQAAGGKAVYRPLDVTKEEDWHQVAKMVDNEYGWLNILVNNAGTGVRENVEDTTTALWDNQMAVHAKGAFLGTRAAIPLMRKAGGGRLSIYHRFTASLAAPHQPLITPRRGRSEHSPKQWPSNTPRRIYASTPSIQDTLKPR